MVEAVIVRFLFIAGVILTGMVSAYTLKITSCTIDIAGTTDEGITFSFCQGGSYCITADEVPLPPDSGTENSNYTVEIPVALGYVPTTMEIKKSTDGSNSWCINTVVWEGGEDLLGQDSSLYLESETGSGGCIGGLSDLADIVCIGEWRFFNLNDSRDYVYDIRVKACSGTSTGSVQAYLCSHASCNGTVGEEVEATLVLSSREEGGWTRTEISSGFNPVAIRLSEVDDSWCAEQLTFNLFLVLNGPINATDFQDSVNGTPSIIVKNIQANGVTSTPAPFANTPAPLANTPAPFANTPAPLANTPAPTSSTANLATIMPTTQAPDATTLAEDEGDTMLFDAASEITATIIAAAITAAAAGVLTLMCKRWAVRRDEARAAVNFERAPTST